MLKKINFFLTRFLVDPGLTRSTVRGQMTICARSLLARALRGVASPLSSDASIHLALSGGVDSSVAGFLLKEQGWNVKPVLLRCWDDDTSEQNITPCYEADLRAANAAVKALRLSTLEVFDFIEEYWTDVFDGVFLSGLLSGQTPNPDLACNRAVKFGAFPERLRKRAGTSSTPRFATGHYARLRHEGGRTTLLAAVDEKKDQTYFLSSVPGDALTEASFPVGGLLKEEVRALAEYAGLPAAEARSSRGICFVGKRPMGPFLERYLEGREGRFVDADSGAPVADLPHPAYVYTAGQRAKVGGLSGEPLYIVGRDRDDVVVVPGRDHPRLFVQEQVCDSVDWVAGEAPEGLFKGEVRLEYKANSTARRKWCKVEWAGDGLKIRFEEDQRIIVPGQALVLYEGSICLGAAWPVGQERATALRHRCASG